MRNAFLTVVLFSVVACSSSSFDVAPPADAIVVDSDTVDSSTADSVTIEDTSEDTLVIPDAIADTNIDAGPCDPAEPAPTNAVYASAGSASGGDGTPGAPFATIGDAITAARMKGRSRVIVDEGTYPEVVRFVDSDPGVFVEGGWKRESGGWKRHCDADARTRTIINSNAVIAVFVENVVHLSGLRKLTARTKSGGASLAGGGGESLFGVRVRGDGSRFALHDVVIESGSAGSGTPGTPTTSPPVACNGVSDCATGGVGSPGSTGTKAVPGMFSPTGYQTGDGGNGSSGTKGFNGSPGTTSSIMCVTNCGEGMCFSIPSCPKTTAPMNSSGKCGCGGAGGAGGTGGPGGGASVALFVSGAGAKVMVTESKLRSGSGGYGAGANAGQSGASGTAGKSGEPISCTGSCMSYNGGACGTGKYYCLKGAEDLSAPPGAAGGNGGTGGKGGDGAGGAGGPSHAVVLIGSADAIVDPLSVLTFSAGGMGLNGAPNGGSSATFIQP